MQFFLQSAVVDKGSRARDLPAIRVDVIVGSVLAIVLAGFMIIANGATIYQAALHTGKPPLDIGSAQASDFALALKPLAGNFAELLFAFGILNAGIFTATVLPLSTAYIVCEAFGLEASLDRRFREAPVFYTLFAGAIVLGAGLVLLVPKASALQVHLLRAGRAGRRAAVRAGADADDRQQRAGDGPATSTRASATSSAGRRRSRSAASRSSTSGSRSRARAKRSRA